VLVDFSGKSLQMVDLKANHKDTVFSKTALQGIFQWVWSCVGQYWCYSGLLGFGVFTALLDFQWIIRVL
jgi:hypothetical protein